MSGDPTEQEMLEHLDPAISIYDACEVDVRGAIYWFASDHHSGRASNLYSVLSTSEYRPGPLEDGPEEGSVMAELYSALEEEFSS